MVDTSFFWGYLITQIPGGFLASMFPANQIFGVAIFTSAVLNVIVPTTMDLDNVAVTVIIRAVQGLVEVRKRRCQLIPLLNSEHFRRTF